MEEFIQLYTDGSSRGNPGPGGYGYVLIFRNNRKEGSQGFRKTTNNRMELLAVIEGLRQLKTNQLPVVVYSDSKYVIDSIEKGWLYSWVKIQFKNKKNKDLWLQFLEVSKPFKLQFKWVKGHNGHPENERCDALAVAAATGTDLRIDGGFETMESTLL